MSIKKKNTFDEALNKIKSKNLENQSSLEQVTLKSRNLENGKWLAERDSVVTKGTGKSDKVAEYNEIQKQIKDQYQNNKEQYGNDPEDFEFSCKTAKGDVLPAFENLKRVDTGDVVGLKHQPGEVLLIDVWATWCGPCQKPMQHNEDMLKKNEKEWAGKVRIVGVSVDDDLDELKKRIDKKDWKRIEHLTLGGWDGEHSLIKTFQVSGIPFVCLIDKEGKIDYMGHPAKGNLETRINQLIEQAAPVGAATETTASPTVEHKESLTEDSWQKFEKIISGLTDEDLENFSVTAEKVRKWKNGNLVMSVNPIKIAYRTKKEKKDQAAKLAQKLVEGLEPNEYVINAFVDDPEEQLLGFQKNVNSLIGKCGMSGETYISQKYTLNLNKDSKWGDPVKELKLPNIIYKQKEDYKGGEKFREQFLNYIREVEDQAIGPIEGLAMKLPFSITGSKFAGIHGLKKYGTNELVDIVAGDGKSHIITICVNGGTSESHVEALTNRVKVNNDVVLHVIQIDEDEKIDYIDKQLAQGNLNIHFYKGNHQENPDIAVLGIRQLQHTVFVDKHGIVTSLGNFTNYDDVKSSYEATYTEPQAVTAETVQKLQDILKNEAVTKLVEHLKQHYYNTEAELSYEQYLGAANSYSNFNFSIGVRDSSKPFVEPVVKLVKELGGSVNVTYVETFNIPEGKTCETCKAELKYPHYYFFTSNVHRCRDCTEKQDPTAPPMTRYAINENSIVVFKPNQNVDRKRMGKNIQPKNESECNPAGFMCNGCRGGGHGQARYISMGCRREPNTRGDYVDFCYNCFKKLAQGTEDEKKLIEEANEDEGCKRDHPLLRTLYGPKGYYEF